MKKDRNCQFKDCTVKTARDLRLAGRAMHSNRDGKRMHATCRVEMNGGGVPYSHGKSIHNRKWNLDHQAKIKAEKIMVPGENMPLVPIEPTVGPVSDEVVDALRANAKEIDNLVKELSDYDR